MELDWRGQSPAQLVAELKDRYGSDDKLAAALRAKGHPQASRQTTIRWRQGKSISEAYAETLAELSGYPAEAFQRPSPEQVAARLEAALERAERVLDELPPLLDAARELRDEG